MCSKVIRLFISVGHLIIMKYFWSTLRFSHPFWGGGSDCRYAATYKEPDLKFQYHTLPLAIKIPSFCFKMLCKVIT